MRTLILESLIESKGINRTAKSCLLGTSQGGSDVLRMTETKLESMTVTGVDPSKEHFVSLSAINKAGLYVTMNITISHSGIFTTPDMD